MKKTLLLIVSLACIMAFAAEATTVKLKHAARGRGAQGGPIAITSGGGLAVKTCKDPCSSELDPCGINSQCTSTKVNGEYSATVTCACKNGFSSSNQGRNCT